MAVYIKQCTLVVTYTYDINVDSNHLHSEVKESTTSCNKPNQPHGSIDGNGIVFVYDELGILLILKDFHLVYQQD